MTALQNNSIDCGISFHCDLVLVTQLHQTDFSHLQPSSKDFFQTRFSESVSSR